MRSRQIVPIALAFCAKILIRATFGKRTLLLCVNWMLGKRLGGRYQIISLLAGGGFGTTFIAEDQHLPGNPRCVIKQLKPKTTDNSSALQAARRLFNREAEVLYQLGNHEQIPRLFAHFEEDQEFYLVQEFIEGYELKNELSPDKPLSESYVILLLQEILEILAFVHQKNVIHRDIKPSNLIRRQQDRKLFLIDFGAVKQIGTHLINPQSQTSFTIVIGSPGYMPSEQLAGKPRFCSDLYAVGILGIQALTGLHPNDIPEDPQTSEIMWRNQAQVSAELGNILDKMVCYDFRQRYQSAPEVLQALNAISPSSFTAITTPVILEPDPASLTASTLIVPNDLSSEQGLDYTRLHEFLAEGKWKEADLETEALFLKVSSREQRGFLRAADMTKFPCQELRSLDELWVKFSKGRFGFSIQQRIWEEVGGKPNADYETWERFGDQVGWRVMGSWLLRNDLIFSSSAPLGHLPQRWVGWGGRYFRVRSLFSRVEACRLDEPTLELPDSQLDTSGANLRDETRQSLSSVASRIAVIQGNIIQQRVDAIIHATAQSSEIEDEFYQAAGEQLQAECRQMKGRNLGDARITQGYNLPAQWVIHTIFPVWQEGNNQEAQLLAQCYDNCLMLAAQHSLRIIAFPAISAETFGFPIELSTQIAVTEIKSFLERDTSLEQVIIVCSEETAYEGYTNLVKALLKLS